LVVVVEPAAVAGLVDGLRVDDREPEAEVERQLVVRAPGVLQVVEVPPLPLARVRRRADVALEERHVAEQERREPEPAARRSDRAVGVKLQLARPMRVARHAQVVRAADVDPGLEGVGRAQDLREVGRDLPLRLVLGQRAVAAVDAEAIAEAELVLVALDVPVEEPRGEVVPEVQARDAGGGRGRRPEVARQHVHLVVEPPEADVEDRGGRQRVVETQREALVLHLREAALVLGEAAAAPMPRAAPVMFATLL
jgi:hypothetical protein